MFYHDLDDLPTDNPPEHLVVISTDTFQQAKRTRESGKFLLGADKHFLVMPTVEEAKNHPIIRPIYEANNIKENTILLKTLQNNNPNYYLPYDMFAKQSLEIQMLNFPTLCQHLGAKQVKLIMTETLQEILSTNAELEAKIKVGNIKSGANFEKNNSTNKSTDLITEFEGGKINLKEAKNLMDTGIFYQNQYIVSFYNSAINTENRMKTQIAKITIDQNISKQLDLFIKADIPILKTIFNAEMKTQMKKLQSLKIEYEVIF